MTKPKPAKPKTRDLLDTGLDQAQAADLALRWFKDKVKKDLRQEGNPNLSEDEVEQDTIHLLLLLDKAIKELERRGKLRKHN